MQSIFKKKKYIIHKALFVVRHFMESLVQQIKHMVPFLFFIVWYTCKKMKIGKHSLKFLFNGTIENKSPTTFL